MRVRHGLNRQNHTSWHVLTLLALLLAGSTRVTVAASRHLASGGVQTEGLEEDAVDLQTKNDDDNGHLSHLKTRSLGVPNNRNRHLEELTFLGNAEDTYYLCEGDCDYDRDCGDGLVCFQRDGKTDVPGCSGSGITDVDYCIVDPDLVPANSDELLFVDDEPDDRLGRCQGDCDDDDDCRGDLICFMADVRRVPGCEGRREDDGVQYCMDLDDLPDESDELLNVGDDIAIELGRCMGNCDQDSDCSNGLECFVTDGEDEVPGCEGDIDSGTNYCYDPADVILETSDPTASPVQPTLKPTASPTVKTTSKPTLKPTASPTVQSTPEPTTASPTVQATAEPTTAEPTMAPTSETTDLLSAMGDSDVLIYVGDARDIGTIGKCMGHCSTGAHCRGSLECFEVEGATEVPGCVGVRTDGVGYCYDPMDETVDIMTTPTALPTESETEVFPTADPTFPPTQEPTTATPTLAPATAAPVTAAPSAAPTSAPVVPETPEPTDALPTARPTAEPKSGEPRSHAIPPFVIELGFLTPSRRLNLLNRHLLIKENINEEEELLNTVASLLGDEIRALDPASYLGILLRVAFVDEVAFEGTTTVAYEFAGEAKFAEGSGVTPNLVEAATRKAMEGDDVANELRRSGDPVMEAVQFVSVPDAGISTQGDTENRGIEIGIIVIVAVVAACVVVIGGALIYMRRRNKVEAPMGIASRNSRSFEGAEKGNDANGSLSLTKSMKMSKRIMSNLPSPAKTKSTNDSRENSLGDDVESAVESSAAPGSQYEGSVFEASSTGGSRSDWSVDGHVVGYTSEFTDDASSNAEGARFTQRRDINLTNTVVALAEAQARAEKNDVSTRSEADLSVDTDNMSALGEVRLGSVLQVEEGQGNGDKANAERGSGDDFKDVWKKEEIQNGDEIPEQATPKASPRASPKRGLFGISFRASKTQKDGGGDPNLSLNNSADAESVLNEMIGVVGIGNSMDPGNAHGFPGDDIPAIEHHESESEEENSIGTNDVLSSEACDSENGIRALDESLMGSVLGGGSDGNSEKDALEADKELYVL